MKQIFQLVLVLVLRGRKYVLFCIVKFKFLVIFLHKSLAGLLSNASAMQAIVRSEK